MAIVHPFKGWLPKTDYVDEVACVPYDVISKDEAAEMALGKPTSFLHVIRPEIDLPDNTPFHADAVYEKGAENLKKLIESPVMQQDSLPHIYIYQLETEEHKQTGVFTCVSVQDYDNDVILKHELTRPDKEDDRTRHILEQSAHAEPVMFTYKDDDEVQFLIEKTTVTSPPVIEHTGEDGVIHKVWKTEKTADFAEAFSKVPHMYVADGHHRCKAASRAAEKLRKEKNIFPGEAEFEYFPAVIFPMSEMKILPYNRIVSCQDKSRINDLFSTLNPVKTERQTPDSKGSVHIYYSGSWYKLELPEPESENVVSNLDASRLQNSVLKPFFGIENPRTNPNINFVGGIRGTGELERLVDKNKADIAFSMYPTSIEELVAVSDAGLLMPPKSTWFEPKLKSGIIIHTF
ncbi:MAG TPA: DUF1015 family protein [Balneolaceae bacterium]|nr:DUF1015 family protein [Balneolaceae bacterium]